MRQGKQTGIRIVFELVSATLGSFDDRLTLPFSLVQFVRQPADVFYMRLDCSPCTKAPNMVFVTRELIGIVCVLSSVCFGQVTGPTGPDTAYAPCLEGQVGVRSYQSPVLVSPDGLWRAYVNVEARPGGDVGCSNLS